jgi:hypothetical protein
LTSTVCEKRSSRVVRMFCLLDMTYVGSRGQFQRNGGVRSATTMCWLLFKLVVKRYLFTWYSCFDSVILTLLLFSLGHAEGN